MAKKYQDVRCTDTSLDIYDFEGDPKVVMERIQNLIDIHTAKGHTDLYIDISVDAVDSYADVDVMYTRKETDKERDRRLARAAKARVKGVERATARVEKEKAEYERLQKKYG